MRHDPRLPTHFSGASRLNNRGRRGQRDKRGLLLRGVVGHPDVRPATARKNPDTRCRSGSQTECCSALLSADSHLPVLVFFVQLMPSLSAAILVPSTRALIFWNAMSRATSGEP